MRDKCRNALCVVLVGDTELLSHPLLLDMQLSPERPEGQSNGHDAAPFGARERGTDKCEQQPGVDGMAHEPVRSRGDQLVVLLDCDRATPIAAKVYACLHREEKAGQSERRTDPEGPKADRHEVLAKSRYWGPRERQQN